MFFGTQVNLRSAGKADSVLGLFHLILVNKIRK